MIRLRKCPSAPSVFASLLFASFYAASEYRHVLHRRQLDVPVTVVLQIISAFFLFVGPISQPQSYHNFADRRRCVCRCGGMMFLPPNYQHIGIVLPNFGDTASNVVILLGGLSGVVSLVALDLMGETETDGRVGIGRTPSEEWQLGVCLPLFFAATVTVSIGSTYYHWNPNNSTLVWDRLPMTVAFAAIFCYMLDEYLPAQDDGSKDESSIGQDMLLPLIITGIASVLYWSWTDDLRLYAVVSIFPMLLMVVLVLCCSPPRHGGTVQQVVGLLLYSASKICEDKDYEIFNLTGKRVSGHSLKHILAGLAPIAIAHMVFMRKS